MTVADYYDKQMIATAYADRILEDGWIRPPCKVGDTVYCLIQGFEQPLKANVKKIVIQESGVVISCSIYGYFGQSFMATDFGKTAFLTREEAEKALAERNCDIAQNIESCEDCGFCERLGASDG